MGFGGENGSTTRAVASPLVAAQRINVGRHST